MMKDREALITEYDTWFNENKKEIPTETKPKE